MELVIMSEKGKAYQLEKTETINLSVRVSVDETVVWLSTRLMFHRA